MCQLFLLMLVRLLLHELPFVLCICYALLGDWSMKSHEGKEGTNEGMNVGSSLNSSMKDELNK